MQMQAEAKNGPKRCAGLAKDRGLAGPIHPAASAFCKHPPRQIPDDEAFAELERFIRAN
jgi:myo-inositol-1-phosphate synthase